MQLTQFSATQKQKIIEREAKKGSPWNIFSITLLHNYTDTVELQIRFLSHTLLTEEGILTLSSLAQKLQSKKGWECG